MHLNSNMSGKVFSSLLLADTIHVPIKKGQRIDLCGEINGLFTYPATTSWESQSGSLQAIIGSPFCRKYAHKPGIPEDEVIFEACDSLGNCRTTVFLIHATPYDVQIIRDTVVINFSQEACAAVNELPYSLSSITPVLINPGSGAIEFNVQGPDACISYAGKKPGSDTLQLFLRDEDMNTDTALLLISCRMPRPQKISDTLYTGETALYCLENNELAGTLAGVSNPCLPGSTHGSYKFDVQQLCLEVEAKEIGRDSTCYVLCDQFGVCDTFNLYFHFQFNPIDYRIGLTDDYLSVEEGGIIESAILENDTLPGGVYVFDILYPIQGGYAPQFGQVRTKGPEMGNLFVYESRIGQCSVRDSVNYIACNEYFCDTATIYIDIRCVDDPINVHNGFSPNGDGINDTFVIKGLDLFDYHHLKIYNRWGTLLYETEDYQNNWGGIYQGNPLPDGTYFYHLDTEGGRTYRGFIELRAGR